MIVFLGILTGCYGGIRAGEDEAACGMASRRGFM